MSDYVFNYSQYKNKITKKSNGFTILFLVIILLLGFIVFLRPNELKTNKLYFVQAEEFQTYQDSKKSSQDTIKNEGAGYIYFNEKYHVLISFHSSKIEAKKMLKTIKAKHKNASIYSLKKQHFSSQKNLKKTQNKAIKNFADKSEKISLKLENYCSSFFNNSLDLKTLSIHLQNFNDDFEKNYDKLIKSFNSNPKFNIAKKHANTMLKSISNLSANSEQISLSSMKYEIINFVLNRHQFLSCF